MKYISAVLLSFLLSVNAFAETAKFELSIMGDGFKIKQPMALSDIGEGETNISFDFEDTTGAAYNFDLKYKALPKNRSYPTNLDITIKNAAGKKLGYLFWANNGVKAMKQVGVFGLVVNIEGSPVDFKLTFDANKKGKLRVSELETERFVQDTLVPKFGFQMIRPVLIPSVSESMRSQTYALDAHPYAVNYTLKNIENGGVEFQYNFMGTNGGKQQLLERIYYQADSLETLRSGMFAGKYFDDEVGSVKLVFYPTLGQTQPPAK